MEEQFLLSELWAERHAVSSPAIPVSRRARSYSLRQGTGPGSRADVPDTGSDDTMAVQVRENLDEPNGSRSRDPTKAAPVARWVRTRASNGVSTTDTRIDTDHARGPGVLDRIHRGQYPRVREGLNYCQEPWLTFCQVVLWRLQPPGPVRIRSVFGVL